MTHHIAVPPLLRIGGGAIDGVAALVTELGAERPVIVTDSFLAGTPAAARIAEVLRAQGISTEVFSGTVPDPTSDSLVAGLEIVQGHDADLLIALGGGSPIDTAKALAVLAVRGGTMRDLRAPVQYDGAALPIIAIPTTAGTGSEATRFTIITDSTSNEKMLCAGPSYLPSAAIVDYELTLTMPARLTADTGIDALTHAIESYVSTRANGFSDALALSAMKTIGENLRLVYANGADIGARAAMMEAATFAGIAFSNSSVALVHGMSRPLGAHFHVAHGMANAMLFVAVTEFSIGSAISRYAECARAIGAASGGMSDEDAAHALVAELRALSRELAVPTPEEFGVAPDDWERAIPVMAEQALASGSPANNPRVPTASEIADLYRAIYSHSSVL